MIAMTLYGEKLTLYSLQPPGRFLDADVEMGDRPRLVLCRDGHGMAWHGRVATSYRQY